MAAYEEQDYNKPFQLKIWAKLLPFFRPYRKFFVITLTLNILLAGVDILVPLFQSYAINHFIVPVSYTHLYVPAPARRKASRGSPRSFFHTEYPLP